VLCGVTDIGFVRERNEDDFLISPDGVLVVADGLGGLPAGEVASETAVATAALALAGKVDRALDASTAEGLLRSAFVTANRAVTDRAAHDRSCTGMATTLVIALVLESSLTVAHVGDVRAYRLGRERLDRLTDDHTRAWERVVSGEISEQAAKRSPYRNALTRVLGCGDVEPSVRTVELAVGDVVLLCSDGLWDPVEESRIEDILRNRAADAPSRATALADAALAAGGPDNITAVVYQHS
jgi:serine/threonine protein phosphatase PrpC